MLSKVKGFLFVHIPKTGGNSIQRALAPYSDDDIVCISRHQDGVDRFELRNKDYATHKHSSVRKYKREYGSDLFDGLFKFTVIRNTYDRLISFYFSPHRRCEKWDEGEFSDFIMSVKPIKHYIAFDGQSLGEAVANFDMILKYDSLSKDFLKLAHYIGIEGRSLPHVNRSERLDSGSYYNEHLLSLVYSIFGEEVDYFRFSPPKLC